MNPESVEQRLQCLEDRLAIKEVVDTFSNLADIRQIATQMHLFTEDAVVQTHINGALFSEMKGRQAIERGFLDFIADFETMYHINGQLVVELDGDHAAGHHYCQVMLIGSTDGKKTLNTNGVIYDDSYIRTTEGWKIAKRISHFTWRDVADMSNA